MTANTPGAAGFVPLPAMIAAQAANNPGGMAFQVDDRTLNWQTLHTHVTQVAHVLIHSGVRPGDKVAVVGFSSLAYIECFFGTIAARACAVPLPASAQHITQTMLVPVQYQRILAYPDFARSDLSALEVSQSTGAPMDAALKRDIIDRWPGRFLDVYGLTEGGVNCYLEVGAHPDKLGTVGKPGQGSEVFLIDEAGKRLPPDQVGVAGEVVGRSAFMMAGYHNRPDADAEIRWLDEEGRVHHRSGDIGRFDADGFLTLLDRSKDVIISGGNNIYAADLEGVLARHPDVLEAAVIGVPSPAWGETPLALAVLRPGAAPDPAALCERANTQLGKTQRLSAVEVRAELPRSMLGKLSKKELRAPYWSDTNKATA